VDHLKP
jgi:hypothetical protein